MSATTKITTYTYRDCWLLFGDVDDLGWTHAHNQARKQIHTYMRRNYGSSSDSPSGSESESSSSSLNNTSSINWKFESLAIPNTFFMSNEERHTLITERLIKKEKCNFIFASSKYILNNRDYDYANTYPNISWGRKLTPPDLSINKPSNLIDYWTDWFSSAFIAGSVVAATTTTTATNTTQPCAGFINAYEKDHGDSWGHTTGFTMGYQWWQQQNFNYANTRKLVHVVTMNSYFNPDAELVVAKQLVENFGCNVIGKHTDPNDVDRYVYGLREKYNDGRKIVSISRYIDMSLFVGDTVITSLVSDFFPTILPSIESSFLLKKLNIVAAATNNSETTSNSTAALPSGGGGGSSGSMYEYDKNNNDELLFSKPLIASFYEINLSPFTNYIDENLAEQTMINAIEYLKTNNPLCDKRWRINGIRTDNNYNNDDTGPSCQNDNPKTPNEIPSYLDLGPSVMYYDVPFQDGGVICGPGTYYEYDSRLNLTCTLCPLNTYRNIEDGSRVEDSCIPCTNGTWSPQLGSTYCKPYVEEDFNYLDARLRYYGLALSALIVLLSIIFALFVHVYEKHRVVQASQPVFLYIVLLGTFGMGLSIIPLTIDDSVASQRGCNIACLAFPWLLVLGFSASFAALFSKIWRLNKIFHAARMMKQIKVNTRDVMIPFVTFMSLNVLLLLCWTIVSPPQYERIYTSDEERNHSYGTCWSSFSNASITIAVALLVINSSAVILANVQAYRARFISDEFSESKYIGLINLMMLQILLVGIPLIFLVHENPRAEFFVVSSIVLILSLSLLLLIFVPKLKYVIRGDNGNINDSLFITQSLQGIFGGSIHGYDASGSLGGESLPACPTTSIRSGGSSGVRYTNMAEVVTTLQSQLKDYKLRLMKTKAILRQHGLDVTNDVPLVEEARILHDASANHNDNFEESLGLSSTGHESIPSENNNALTVIDKSL